ncbi:MAG: hypothetical protein JWO94_1275 [Verrucomicrobiaceae bacterium]|nr:hypothetical protein [Verrucomicrobiaceae bacterium]
MNTSFAFGSILHLDLPAPAAKAEPPPPSPHSHHMTACTLMAFGSLSMFFAATAIPGTPEYAQWVFVTLGSSLASFVCSYALNEDKDKPRQLVGRAVFAAVCAVILPRTLLYMGPDLADPLKHPVLCVLGGLIQWLATDLLMLAGTAFASGLLGYAISPALMQYLFRRVPPVMIARADDFIGANKKTTPSESANIPPP